MNETHDPTGRRRIRHPSLLNKSEVREFVLDTIQRTRPTLRICRVSREALQALEDWLRERIRGKVHSHPSVGKTFKL